MEWIDSLARAINNFGGGMILVSHDMRLISQVAKEIWLCDNRTVSKYIGEIADFKMQLRKQILSGDGSKKLGDILVAPIAPKKLIISTDAGVGGIPIIAPIIVPAAKQIVTVSQENCLEEIDEKALAKAKRKAEKEAMIALQKKEEEERQRRKEEKLQEAEEAKKLKEAEMKLREEADRLKAQHEEQQRLEFEAVLEAERKKHERLNAEKILRKLDKKMIRLNCELEKERFFQISVFQDNWNQEQQNNFEDALLEFTSAVLKYDRWVSVALKVTGKTKQQCLARYKHLRSIALSNTDN